MRSLRSRLLVGVIGSMALLLVLFGSGVYLSVRHALLEEFDRSLATAATALASATEREDDEVEVEFGPEHALAGDGSDARTYFQLWLGDGTVLMRSLSLGGADLPRFHGNDRGPRFRPLVLAGGAPGRAAGIRFVPKPDDGLEGRDERGAATAPALVLVVARETTALESRLRALAWLLVGAGAGIMGVAVVVSTAIVSRGLGPLRAVAAKINAIRADDLADRVPDERLPTEMAPVVARLNDLLARLEAAFDRERAFTSDAAHELRTPLSGLRSTIEVTLGRVRTAEDYREALTDCLDITKRMQAVVDSLILLAQLDAGKVLLRREALGVAALLDSCWQPVASRAQARGLTFDNRIPPDLTCTSDREYLAMVFSNLLDNAAEYADDGGRIRAAVITGDDCIQLSIANTGCALTPEQVRHAGERFWRADPSRADTGVHTGLGLALVRRIMAVLGGTAVFGVEEPSVFTATLTAPADAKGVGPGHSA